MSNDSGQNDSSDEPKANPQEEKLKEARRLLPTPVVSIYILSGIATVSASFGGGLLNAQFFYVGWGIIWIGISCGCWAGRLWIINHRTKHRMPVWLDLNWTFAIIILVFALACYGAAFFSSPKQINFNPVETVKNSTSDIPPSVESKPPLITLEPGPVLNATEPWGTDLIIHNLSSEPISNVMYKAYWIDSSSRISNASIAMITDGLISSTLGGGKSKAFEIYPMLPDSMVGPLINFEITYSTFTSNTFVNSFQFQIAKSSDGRKIWIPQGDGSAFQQFLAANRRPDPVLPPLVAVNINSVENDPTTIPEHPLKINYLWKNIGGQPATKFVIEWGVWDKQSGHIYIWTNLLPKAIFDQVLRPGMTNGETRFYRDKAAPTLFEGIMSSKCILIGRFSYEDTNGVDFTGQIKSIKTNGVFETRYFGIHSKYGDW